MKIQFDKPPGSAQETNGLSVRYAASKRKVPRWRWYLLLAMVLTPPGYLLTRFMVAYWWETAPAVVITEQVVVRAREAGRVTQIADIGALVRAGQPVIALDTTTGATRTPSSAATPRPASDPSQTTLETFASRQTTLDEALRLAEETWQMVNLVNLRQYIAPTKERANLILHKVEGHLIDKIYLRGF